MYWINKIIRKTFAIFSIAIIVMSLYTGAVVAAVNDDLSFSAGLNGFSIDDANTGYDIRYFYAGDMVNIANGNLYLSEKDISVKALAFDLKILRSYNSHSSGNNGPFGSGWTHNYNIKLEQSYLSDITDGPVTLHEGDGSVYEFELSGTWYLPSQKGIYSKLKKNSDGSFVLYLKDGSKYNFNSNEVLTDIIDKNDVTIQPTHISRLMAIRLNPRYLVLN